jgi:hypothetical protein
VIQFLPTLVENFALLKHYSPQLLEKLIESKDKWDPLKRGLNDYVKNKSLMKLVRIHAGVESEAKDLSPELLTRIKSTLEPFLEEGIRVLDSIEREQNQEWIPITESLQQVMGGKQFVKSCVWLPQGIFVNNLIALKNGHHPVPVGGGGGDIDCGQIRVLSDQDLPSDCKLVAVLPLHRFWDCLKDGKTMNSRVVFKQRILKRLGIHSFTVHPKEWDQLKENERIPFLKEKISSEDSSVFSVP